MLTYETLIVPTQIHSSLIISAFDNIIDEDSLNYYRGKDLSQVEDILGYPERISEDDIGSVFISGMEIMEEHIGLIAWYVTDGHHRSIIANEQGLNLSVRLDRSSIVSEEDLINYDKFYNNLSNN